jgi:asparagine synthase (glutamine-hydrolysing)
LSAIFGIFNGDGQPVDRASLARMDAALADWGPDGGLQIEGQTALGCRLLRITAEDMFERQPLTHEATREPCLLVAHVRLDNRIDLRRQLGLGGQPNLPDSALVMAAYRRYGIECVEHLQGDWVFALWDRTLGRLLLARCATGAASLFWCHQDGRLFFATGIKGVLAHPDCAATPNPRHIACLLMSLEDPEEDSTVFRNIGLLEPGHLLVATHKGVERRRWWQPEHLPPLLLPNSAEYYQAFRELYGTVVSQHLSVASGGIAATLSGGLDSSSVAAIAAARLNEPLKAYVHTPFYEPAATALRIGNELPQARRLAEYAGNIEIVPLDSRQTSIVGAIEQGLRVNAMPAHAAAHEYWLTDILQNAKAAGVRVLLTGQGGNATVSYTGSGNLLPQLVAGQWRPALTALRADTSGLWPAVKRRLLKPIISTARNRLPARPRGDASIVNSTLVERLKISRAADPPFPRISAFRLGLQGAGRGRARWMADAAAHGLDVRDPTRDRRIIEFCWRLPDEVFWANGRQRGLVRVGLAAYLPSEIRDEGRKGLQSSDIVPRMRVQSAEIYAAIDAMDRRPITSEFLDTAAMRSILCGIVAGGNSMSQVAQAHLLARGLSVGCFLASPGRSRDC